MSNSVLTRGSVAALIVALAVIALPVAWIATVVRSEAVSDSGTREVWRVLLFMCVVLLTLFRPTIACVARWHSAQPLSRVAPVLAVVGLGHLAVLALVQVFDHYPASIVAVVVIYAFTSMTTYRLVMRVPSRVS